MRWVAVFFGFCVTLPSLAEDRLPGCKYNLITCQNGGYFNASQCQQQVPCSADFNPPTPANEGKTFMWWNQRNCTCPDGYWGTDCSLVRPPQHGKQNCPADKPYWDGTAINVNNSKHFECFVGLTDTTWSLSLYLHRAFVDVKLDKNGHGSARFVLMNRHRDGSDAPGPHHHWCWGQAENLNCQSDSCVGGSIDGTNKAQLKCTGLKCSSCGLPYEPTATCPSNQWNPALNCHNCSKFLGIEAVQFNSLELDFSDIDVYKGYSNILVTPSINGKSTTSYSMQCHTGSCVAAINEHTVSGPQKYEKLVLGCMAGAILLVLSLFVCAFFVNRQQTAMDPDKIGSDVTDQLQRVLDKYRNELPRFGLAFHKVTYTVQYKSGLCGYPKSRRILKGISGYVAPGELVAILGPSGAGKSSLLNILADRAKHDRIGGYVGLVSDTARCKRRGEVISYVLQDDCLLGTQTVREALMFSARLRLPPSYSFVMLKLKVSKLMVDLGIFHIADTKIGTPDEGGGISGGERKRVAIGMELIADPRLLLLDEPTSGLDSRSAQTVVKVLQKTAQEGCACILTIHQPPADVFRMFDKVLLVTKHGQEAFMGPPMQALQHMTRAGFIPKQKMNPAEYLLEVASGGLVDRLPDLYFRSLPFRRMHKLINRARQVEQRGFVLRREQQEHKQTEHKFSSSSQTPLLDPAGQPDSSEPGTPTEPLKRSNTANSLDEAEIAIHAGLDAHPHKPARVRPSVSIDEPYDQPWARTGPSVHRMTDVTKHKLKKYKRSAPSTLVKLVVLIARQFSHLLRDPTLFLMQLLVSSGMAVVLGVVFWHVTDDLKGAQNRTGALFFIIFFFCLMSLSSMAVLTNERTLFLRERAAGYYTTFPFFVTKLVGDLVPLRVLPAICFGSIMYYMVAFQHPFVKFGIFLAVLVLANMTSASVCFAASAATGNVGQANLLSTMYFLLSMVYGGMLVQMEAKGFPYVPLPLPPFLANTNILHYLSHFHYAFEALMTNEFSGLLWTFDPASAGSTTNSVYGNIHGSLWLAQWGVDPSMLYWDMVILLCMFGFFTSLTYIFLRYASFSEDAPGKDPAVKRKSRRLSLSAVAQDKIHRKLKQQIGILFVDVTYTVPVGSKGFCNKKDQKTVLKGVSGYIAPGELVAVLGPSGAGKSSFMDIVGCREKAGQVGGELIFVSDSARLPPKKDWSTLVSYVLQDDCLLPTHTVEEALLFSARMRLPPEFNELAIRHKVRQVMEDLCIESIAHSKIGSIDSAGGISGGERKRVAIGVELVADPRLLLLDEPTSGLDSYNTEVVMEVLRKCATRGCTVVVTIHQPPSKVFHMFSQVMLFTRGGRQAYLGPPENAVAFVQQFTGELDQWTNPAEVLLDLASDTSDSKLDEIASTFRLCEEFRLMQDHMEHARNGQVDPATAVARSLAEQGDGAVEVATGAPISKQRSRSKRRRAHSRHHQGPRQHTPELKEKSYGATDLEAQTADSTSPGSYQKAPELPLLAIPRRSSLWKFLLLCHRALTKLWRDPKLLLMQMVGTCVVAVVTGLIFWDTSNQLQGVWDRTTGLFFMIMFFALASLSSMSVLHSERVLFMRERASHVYNTVEYFLATMICDVVPMRVLPPIAFASISYWMVGLNDTGANHQQFTNLVKVLVAVNLSATAFCFAVSSFIRNVGTANLVASLYFIFAMLYGGLFLNNKTEGAFSHNDSLAPIHWILQAVKHMSIFQYAFEALMVNEFVGITWYFTPKDIPGGLPPAPPQAGEVWLANFGMDWNNFDRDLGVLWALFAGFTVLSCVALTFRKQLK